MDPFIIFWRVNLMVKKLLRVGIVGCGDIFGSHAQAYPDHPNAVVVGFYDRIRSRAQAWFDHLKRYYDMVYEGAQAGLEDSDKEDLERCRIFKEESKVYERVDKLFEKVDAIDVCTPNYAHAPYAIWALKKHKSVMTEKPPARCSLETKWIVEAAKNSKGFYQINENMFFQAYVREFAKLVSSGKLGKILKITSILGHSGPSWGWNNHFLNPSLSGGGAMSDMGIHAIGVVFGIIGADYKVQRIKTLQMRSGTMPERHMMDSDGANEYSLRRFMVEDDAKVFASVKNAKTGEEIEITIETSWARTINEVIVEGEKGTATMTEELKRKNKIELTFDGEISQIPIPGQGRDSHQLEIVDFLRRIEKGQKSFVDELMAHEMQTIISGSYLSNLRGFQLQKTEGVEITHADIDAFYSEILNSGCPDSLLIDEIIYRFMSPFTGEYFTPGEKFKEI